MATNYIRNRVLHLGINAIRFQRWYVTKPSVRHLKRYGCIAYVHQPKVKRSKFQPRAQRGIFVGYGLESSGYRIYFPNEKVIVESKHVTFDEAQLGKSSSRNITHRPFIDFLDNNNEIFSGIQKSTVETDDGNNPEVTESPTISLEKQPDLPKEDIKEEGGTSTEKSPKNVLEEDPNLITMERYLTVRKKDQSKGKTDVYLLTPCGLRL